MSSFNPIPNLSKLRQELTREIRAITDGTQRASLTKRVHEALQLAEENDPDYFKKSNPWAVLKWYIFCFKQPQSKPKKHQLTEEAKLLYRVYTCKKVLKKHEELYTLILQTLTPKPKWHNIFFHLKTLDALPTEALNFLAERLDIYVENDEVVITSLLVRLKDVVTSTMSAICATMGKAAILTQSAWESLEAGPPLELA